MCSVNNRGSYYCSTGCNITYTSGQYRVGPQTVYIISQQLQTLPSTSTFSQPWIPPRMPTFTMSVNYILPNLSAWTFSNPTVNPTPIVTTVSTRNPSTSVFSNPVVLTPVSNVPSLPVTSGRTVYYVPPATVSTHIVYTTSLSPTTATFVPTGITLIPQPSTTGYCIREFALLLASTETNHLPEWKLAQYSSVRCNGTNGSVNSKALSIRHH